jgi:ATP-dependent Lon protease
VRSLCRDWCFRSGDQRKSFGRASRGIHRILLPARNEADMEEIPEDVRKELEVVPLARIREVFDAALEKFVANPPPPLPPPGDSPHSPEPQPQPLVAKER